MPTYMFRCSENDKHRKKEFSFIDANSLIEAKQKAKKIHYYHTDQQDNLECQGVFTLVGKLIDAK